MRQWDAVGGAGAPPGEASLDRPPRSFCAPAAAAAAAGVSACTADLGIDALRSVLRRRSSAAATGRSPVLVAGLSRSRCSRSCSITAGLNRPARQPAQALSCYSAAAPWPPAELRSSSPALNFLLLWQDS